MMVRPSLCAFFAVMCLLSIQKCLVTAADASGKPGDFEEQLVHEAVDLSAINNEGANMETADMESLLHWAIEHSDADALHKQAEEVRREEAIRDYKERKQRVKELSDILSQQPTETQLMQDHIGVLTDASSSEDQQQAALAELAVLVEPIDNANDLKVLGGLEPLVSLLAPGTAPSLQAGAAHVLGTAVSNNDKLAAALIEQHPDLVQQLLKIAAVHEQQEASNKAMYALARLVAGPAASARAAFYNGGGLGQLQGLMASGSAASGRVKTRAVNLVSDLIEMTANGDDTSLETWNESAMAAFAAAALDLLQQSEALDVKEKALFAMRTLLLRRGAAGGAALAHEGAEAVLREALTELDLLSEQYREQAEAAGAAAGSSDASGTASTAGEGATESEADEASEAAGHFQYAQYVSNICADVLHHLAVHHDEL